METPVYYHFDCITPNTHGMEFIALGLNKVSELIVQAKPVYNKAGVSVIFPKEV
jgi:hypothetical protein